MLVDSPTLADTFVFASVKDTTVAANGRDTLIHGDGKADFSILIDASLDLTKADFIL